MIIFKQFVLNGMICMVSFLTYGQTTNLPPNAKTKTKGVTEIDISQELDAINQYNQNSPIKAKPLKLLNEDEWTTLELNNPDEFNYYRAAQNYYDELSHRVKCALTTDQLWTIYFYDQDMKDELLNY